jgi:exonuclease III
MADKGIWYDRLAQALEKKDGPVVLAGDFNAIYDRNSPSCVHPSIRRDPEFDVTPSCTGTETSILRGFLEKTRLQLYQPDAFSFYGDDVQYQRKQGFTIDFVTTRGCVVSDTGCIISNTGRYDHQILQAEVLFEGVDASPVEEKQEVETGDFAPGLVVENLAEGVDERGSKGE